MSSLFQIFNRLLLAALCLVCLSNHNGCHARSFSKSQTLATLRGGSDSFGFGRTPAKATKRGPFSSSQQSSLGAKIDQDPTPEEQIATKEMLNSFLTRDSRNTFIGKNET